MPVHIEVYVQSIFCDASLRITVESDNEFSIKRLTRAVQAQFNSNREAVES